MSDYPDVFPGDCDERGRIAFDLPQAVTAYCRRKFAGKRVDVEIRERKSRRSPKQNRALHAAWKGWADFLGYPVDELKREVLREVFGTHEITSPLTNEVREVLNEPHTSRLNTAQFAELMERAVITAAGTGYVLELPDEWKQKQAAKQKAA